MAQRALANHRASKT